MLPFIARAILIPSALLAQAAYAATEGSVEIKAPLDGAILEREQETQLVYAVNRGRKGDHVHVYVDGEEIATLHRPNGTYTLKELAAGAREICIKVVNKGHTPIGLERCVNVTVE